MAEHLLTDRENWPAARSLALDGWVGMEQRRTKKAFVVRQRLSSLIGLTGIEPALREELDPKSSASASSATAPKLG